MDCGVGAESECDVPSSHQNETLSVYATPSTRTLSPAGSGATEVWNCFVNAAVMVRSLSATMEWEMLPPSLHDRHSYREVGVMGIGDVVLMLCNDPIGHVV